MPPTLKKLKEDRLSITSKILKKDQDFLPISPELIKDLRDRTLFSTTSMRLSFAQYDKMCNDDEVLTMMSVALDKPKDKLKKFCKYLSVFKQNIYLSPNKITAKITEADTQDKPIFKLPKEVRTAILDKFAEILPSKYVLLDWIDKDKIDWDYLSSNSNAIDLLKKNQDKINWDYLSENPNAIDLLKNRIKYEKSLTDAQFNQLENKINWQSLSKNQNAIKLLEKNQDKIYWYLLCKNPNAIDLIKERIEYENSLTKEEYNDLDDKIIWNFLSENLNAIDLIKERIEYENSLTKEEYNNLNYEDNIDWDYLSTNPNAIDLIKENKDKIDWDYLSTNPNAIDLLKKYQDKIGWNYLPENPNPNAIDLLKKNQDKINWKHLSSNPNAIDLLKDRIEYEKSLTDAQFNQLKNKINWRSLSANPNAIHLLENNKDKINWKYFSKNPAIFKAV